MVGGSIGKKFGGSFRHVSLYACDCSGKVHLVKRLKKTFTGTTSCIGSPKKE